MTEYQSKSGSTFVVHLGSVKLPAIVEKQVETEIRATVLRALGTTELSARSKLPGSIFDTFPGRTLGLWLDPDVRFPDTGGPLGPIDHTLIVREIMQYPLQVFKALGLNKGDPKPDGREVLEAAMTVDEIDPYVKERIKAVAEILPQLEEARSSMPRTVQGSLRAVENRVIGQSLRDQIRLLRDPELRREVGGEESETLDVVAQIFEDGADSIYSPDFNFHRTLRSGPARSARKDTVDGVKDADAIGATTGGFIGTLIGPGVGTAAGAASMGAGASAGWAIAAFVDWLFD